MTTRDTAVYVELFQKSSYDDNWFGRIDRYEGGYCFLNRLISQFTDNPRFLFFVISFISYCCLFKTLTGIYVNGSSRVYPISFICLYTAYFGLLYNGIVMRACLAIALVYLSCVYFYQRRSIIKGVLCFLFACTFHQSAILAIPLPIIFYLGISVSKKNAYIITASLFVAYLVGVSSFTSGLLNSTINMLASKFPTVPLFMWGQLMLDKHGFDTQSSVALSRVFYFFLLFCMIRNEKSDRCNAFVISSIIALFILTLFGNFSLTVRMADYYLLALVFAFVLLISNKTIDINLFTTTIIRVNIAPLVILVSSIFYYIYLSNVGI